jgi:HEAT repeat protein
MVLGWLSVGGCERLAYRERNLSGTENQQEPEPSVTSLESEATGIIRQALGAQDPWTRMHALEVVASSDRADLMPVAVKLLDDESASVRFAAALAVGDSRYAPARQRLHQLLEDSDHNVGIAAAYALCRLGQSKPYEHIVEAIRNADQTVRANAAMLLGKLGDKRALSSLEWVMRDADSDDKVVYQAAEARAMLGDRRIYPRLWTLLISKFMDDRLVGVRAMAALATPEARDALLTMLLDDESEVRLLAAERLGALGQENGEAEVLDFFNRSGLQADKNENSHRAVLAALAIGRIGTPGLAKFLPALLKSEWLQVKLAAAQSVLLLAK